LISGNTLTGSGWVGNGIADVGLDNNIPPGTKFNLSKNGSTATTPEGILAALNTFGSDNASQIETDNGTSTITLVSTVPVTSVSPDKIKPPAKSERGMSVKGQDATETAMVASWQVAGLSPEQIAVLLLQRRAEQTAAPPVKGQPASGPASP
jgi:hypothetical protein